MIERFIKWAREPVPFDPAAPPGVVFVLFLGAIAAILIAAALS